MAPITHVLSFKFKESTSDAEKHLLASSMMALQDQCLLPDSSAKYLTVTGGKNNSPETFDKGFDCTFVVQFDEKDRQYYLDTDPAHQKFKELVGPHVEDIFVFDFTPGVF
ncbi:Dabb family protein [Rhodotorula paludigena]|uniref:Dabb family protein n=1 Tax=Rhodotorula paludigena TaxID=86838 RepID=UPI003173178A